MLGSSFLSSSWETEMFPDWTLQDVSYDNIDYMCSFDRDDKLSVSTNDFSSNSSDFETFNLDAFDNNFPISDAFVSEFLSDSLPDVDFTAVDNFYNQSSSYPSNSSNTSKKRLSYECTQNTKPWSVMSTEEKEKSLISISEVTCKMGIREQLEVIKIMDPNIEISAEMKEFTLDVSLLNDAKWKTVQEFFKKHTLSNSLQNASTDNSANSHKTSKATKSISKKASSSVSRTSRKQRQKKQKSFKETDEYRKLQRKHLRQGIKEEKSGLFVYEKVIKFSSLEEDEDVNILE